MCIVLDYKTIHGIIKQSQTPVKKNLPIFFLFSAKRAIVLENREKRVFKGGAQYRWVILLIFVSSQIVLSISGLGWGALAPFLKKEMAISDYQIGAISSLFFFAAAFSAFPGGIIVDRFGAKTGLILWLALPGAACILMGFLHQYYILFLVFVALSGMGYGLGNPVASKGLFMWFDHKTRGTAFGIRQSAVTVGAAVAGVFLVSLSQKAGPFFSIRFTGMMIIPMAVLAYFFFRVPGGGAPGLPREVPKRERTKKVKIRVLFTNGPLLTASMVMALLGLAQGVVVTFFILYLNEKLGVSLLLAGSLFTFLMVNGTIGRIGWGIASDRLSGGRRKPVLMIIALLATVSTSVLALWSTAWPKALLIPVVVILGLSSVGWNAVGLVLVTEVCAEDQTATSVGFASTIGWAGIFLGPIGFGSVIEYAGYFQAWLSLAFCCLAALILCYLLPSSK